MKRCTECRFCVKKDNGYSNYTVEGCDAYCLFYLNPQFPVDCFYDTDPALDFASNCEVFQAGEPIEIDVDMDKRVPSGYTDDPFLIISLTEMFKKEDWGWNQ